MYTRKVSEQMVEGFGGRVMFASFYNCSFLTYMEVNGNARLILFIVLTKNSKWGVLFPAIIVFIKNCYTSYVYQGYPSPQS